MQTPFNHFAFLPPFLHSNLFLFSSFSLAASRIPLNPQPSPSPLYATQPTTARSSPRGAPAYYFTEALTKDRETLKTFQIARFRYGHALIIAQSLFHFFLTQTIASDYFTLINPLNNLLFSLITLAP